jgi:hypothetical protein
MHLRKLVPVFALGSSLVLASCREREAFPILEEPTASSIRDAAGEALKELVDARAALADASLPPEGAEALARAEERVKRLTEYYAPLLDAHECAYRAYRFYYLEPTRVEGELARVETILKEVARDGGPALESEISEAEVLLAEARAALESDSGATPERLDALARRLSFMLLKGELILE